MRWKGLSKQHLFLEEVWCAADHVSSSSCFSNPLTLRPFWTPLGALRRYRSRCEDTKRAKHR